MEGFCMLFFFFLTELKPCAKIYQVFDLFSLKFLLYLCGSFIYYSQIMFKLLFFIILFGGLMVLLFGFSVIRLLFSGLIGGRKKQNTTQNHRKTQSQSKQSQSRQSQTKQSKKVITPEEGEYIDFEEIKD
jgi:Plant ATP synthase F0.